MRTSYGGQLGDKQGPGPSGQLGERLITDGLWNCSVVRPIEKKAIIDRPVGTKRRVLNRRAKHGDEYTVFSEVSSVASHALSQSRTHPELGRLAINMRSRRQKYSGFLSCTLPGGVQVPTGSLVSIPALHR